MGYSDDSAIIAKRRRTGATLQASHQMDRILGFDLNLEKSESGAQLESLGDTIKFGFGGDRCEAHSPLSPGLIQKLVRERTKFGSSR